MTTTVSEDEPLVPALIAHQEGPFRDEWQLGWLFWQDHEDEAHWAPFAMWPDKKELVEKIKEFPGPRDVYVMDKVISVRGDQKDRRKRGSFISLSLLGEPEFRVEVGK